MELQVWLLSLHIFMWDCFHGLRLIPPICHLRNCVRYVLPCEDRNITVNVFRGINTPVGRGLNDNNSSASRLQYTSQTSAKNISFVAHEHMRSGLRKVGAPFQRGRASSARHGPAWTCGSALTSWSTYWSGGGAVGAIVLADQSEAGWPLTSEIAGECADRWSADRLR